MGIWVIPAFFPLAFAGLWIARAWNQVAGVILIVAGAVLAFLVLARQARAVINAQRRFRDERRSV
jgi:hypothetical protein